MTYDCNSECIDFMLSKGQHKLADFLYSQVNTNSEKQPSRTNGNN
jgi:serum/glucocorticoid-regulated kinase 2